MPKSRDRDRPALRIRDRRQRPVGRREQRLGTEDIAGEDLPRFGQPGTGARDERDANLGLQRGDVLRHRGLADVEAPVAAREKEPSRARAENARRRASICIALSYIRCSNYVLDS